MLAELGLHNGASLPALHSLWFAATGLAMAAHFRTRRTKAGCASSSPPVA
jgi:hypothetical protein